MDKIRSFFTERNLTLLSMVLFTILTYILNNTYGYFIMFFSVIILLILIVNKEKKLKIFLSLEMLIFLQTADMINSRFALNIPDIAFLILLILAILCLIYSLITGLKIHMDVKEKIQYIIFVVIGSVIVLTYALSFHTSGGELAQRYPLFIFVTYLLIGVIYYIVTRNKSLS